MSSGLFPLDFKLWNCDTGWEGVEWIMDLESDLLQDGWKSVKMKDFESHCFTDGQMS